MQEEIFIFLNFGFLHQLRPPESQRKKNSSQPRELCRCDGEEASNYAVL